MVEAARCLDDAWRCVVHCRVGHQPAGLRPFLAAGVHVLFEHRARHTVPGDGASSNRRGLVCRNSSFLRTHRVVPVPVAGDSFYSRPAARAEDLSLADLAGHRSSHRLPLAGVHLRWIRHRVRAVLRCVVAAHVAPALLVAAAGRDGRCAMHAQNAFSFGLGHCGIRGHTLLLGGILDAVGAISVLLHNFRRLFLLELRVDRAGDGLCHRGFVATPAHPGGRAAGKLFLLYRPAVLCVHDFSAYTEFAQYFVVWNANMPEETFFYLIREHRSWWCL